MNPIDKAIRLKQGHMVGVPRLWNNTPMPEAQNIRPDLVFSADLEAKKYEANKMLNQVRDFMINNPEARSLVGAGLGYAAGQGVAAVGNTLLPGEYEGFDPGLFSGMGIIMGSQAGGSAIARALARRQQA